MFVLDFLLKKKKIIKRKNISIVLPLYLSLVKSPAWSDELPAAETPTQ